MAAELDSPFLCNYQDLRDDEEEFGMNQSRWSVVRYPKPSVFPGVSAMRELARHEQLAMPQLLRQTTDAGWYEQTHLGREESSFTHMQTTSLLSDEQYNFGFSPEHNENDFYQLNTENPSPQANYLGVQSDIYSDNVLEDDSIMFDSSNYSNLDKEMKTWLPSLPETAEFVQTPTPGRNRDFLPHTCTQSSFAQPLAIKEEKKSLVTSRLSIFDSEEPLIKEDPDMFFTEFGACEVKYELDVAAEEEVITEISSPQSQSCVPQLMSEWYDSSKLDLFKEELKEEPVSPAPMDNTDDFLEVSDDFPSSQELQVDWSSGPLLPPSASHLRLDIGAAMVDSTQLFGHSLVDTPEVLKPVLKPLGEFDLVNFLLANGDSNNNAVLPTTPVETNNKPLCNSLLERRRGKSHVSMQELRASQLSDEQPSTSDDSTDPLLQRLASESSRPRRQSASRFNQRLEQGLYEDVPPTSDDEDFSPTGKRRRTTSSSSSRRHTNYDSDISSVAESYQKYRERRDRNNVSSKLSRQKRKVTQQKKVVELKYLERDNLRLKRKEEQLSSVLERVNNALKEYLGRIHQ